MKSPALVDRITLRPARDAFTAMQPLGFWTMADCELGNGDHFGLYWPVGRERDEPLVAETHHDEWKVVPYFSSVDAFLNAVTVDGDDDDIGSVDCESDDDQPSPIVNLRLARAKLKQNNPEDAIRHLETAREILPEFTEASALLVSQYRRVGRNEDSVRCAIDAVISPPCFGSVPKQLVGWLGGLKSGPDELLNDPIRKRCNQLRWTFGRDKTNDDYRLMQAAIEDYVAAGDGIRAQLLLESFGQYMGRETVSFQERYQFDEVEHFKRQIELSETLGQSRRPVLD